LHALAAGLSNSRGETAGRAKLTDDQVREIRARYTGGWGEQTKLAREYGVSQGLVAQIVRGAIWTHLDGDYKPKRSWRQSRPVKLSERRKAALRLRYAEGVSPMQLAREFGVGRLTIRDIVRGRQPKGVEQ